MIHRFYGDDDDDGSVTDCDPAWIFAVLLPNQELLLLLLLLTNGSGVLDTRAE